MPKLGAAIVGHRRAVLVVVGALALLAAAGMPRLRADFTVDELFADAGDLRRITKQARERFGNTDNVLIVVVERGPNSDGWSPRLRRIAELTDALEQQPGIARVTSITNLRLNSDNGVLAPLDPRANTPALSESAAAARVKAALATPLIAGRLLAIDGSAAVIVAQLSAEITRADELSTVVGPVSLLVESANAAGGDRVSLGGLPFVRVSVIESMNRDQMRLLPIGFAICLIVLFVTFRWWPALVLPLIAVGLSVLLCVGAMAWSGTPIDVVTNIVPLLIVIIGISDSIHLISRHLEERALRRSPTESAAVATDRVFVACFLTSLTTAIGFASLLGSGVGVLRTFGVVSALGVLIAFSVTIAFLPAALAGAATRPAKRRGSSPSALAPFTRWLLSRRYLILAVLVVCGSASLYSLRHLRVDEGVRRQFDSDTEIGRTMTVLEESFEGLRPIDLLVASNKTGRLGEPEVVAALGVITRWAAAQPEALAARSVSDVLAEVELGLSGRRRDQPASTAEPPTLAALAAVALSAPDLVTADFRHTRISISMADTGSKRTLAFAGRLRARAAAELAPFSDLSVEVGGEGFASSLGLESLIRDLARSLAIAIAGIALVLTLAFRSFRLALIGLIPSGLPIAFGLSYMTARGIPLGTATVIVFSVALGLAVDGTIHVLARYREELARGDSRDEALVAAAAGSGRAIVATCLTLIVGFGVLGFSSFIPIRQFGELIAVSILASLVCQLVFLPPLLSIFAGRG